MHPVLRSAVYADLGDPERALGHDRAAELLAGVGAAPQRVAAHLVHVPPRGRPAVVATLREAARRATAEGAAEVAASYLRRALAEPPDAPHRADVLLELGAAELRSGLPDTTGHLRDACALLEAGPRLVEGTLMLASVLFAQDAVYEATEVLQRSIRSLESEDAASVLRLEAELIMWARLDARVSPMARERLAQVKDRASAESFGGRLLLALTASELARASHRPAEARALAAEALGDGLLLDEENSHAYATAVAVLLSLDDLDAAVRRYTDWLELGRRRGSMFAYASASRFRALAMLRRGDLVEAEADLRAALDATLPLAGGGGYAVAYLAETLAERGHLPEALRLLGEADARDEALPTYQMALRLEVRARLRIAAGDVDRGLADLLGAGARLEALGVHNPSHAAWRSHAALVLLQER